MRASERQRDKETPTAKGERGREDPLKNLLSYANFKEIIGSQFWWISVLLRNLYTEYLIHPQAQHLEVGSARVILNHPCSAKSRQGHPAVPLGFHCHGATSQWQTRSPLLPHRHAESKWCLPLSAASLELGLLLQLWEWKSGTGDAYDNVTATELKMFLTDRMQEFTC